MDRIAMKLEQGFITDGLDAPMLRSCEFSIFLHAEDSETFLFILSIFLRNTHVIKIYNSFDFFISNLIDSFYSKIL
jgi:hypothetical protein